MLTTKHHPVILLLMKNCSNIDRANQKAFQKQNGMPFTLKGKA